MIQHEMDHLDGVLILDRTTRDQRKQAMRALREAPSGRAAARACVRTVYLGTSDVRRRGARAPRRPPHRPRSSSRGPTPRRGRGRQLAAAAGRRRGARARASSSSSPSAQRRRALARIAAAEPDAVLVCAYGALIREPLLSSYEILNVHPSLLPRWRGAAPVERAIMAGDARDRRLDHAPHRGPGRGPGVPAGARADRARRRLRHARARGCETLGGELLVRALDERPPFAEQDEDGVTYAREDRAPGDRALDPARARPELERIVRALRPHIGAPLPLPRRLVARRPARPRRRARAAGLARLWTSWRSSPRAASRWTPPRTCAGAASARCGAACAR